jgi:hypothetical protein
VAELSPLAGVVAEAAESAAEVLALPAVVVLVSELELHELRASTQAAKRGNEARNMGVGGEKERL